VESEPVLRREWVVLCALRCFLLRKKARPTLHAPLSPRNDIDSTGPRLTDASEAVDPGHSSTDGGQAGGAAMQKRTDQGAARAALGKSEGNTD